jgi:ActR/RegA family two-component response regulator
MEGIKVLTTLLATKSGVKVLMITGYSDIKTAVEVIKLGAFDLHRKTADTR